MVGFDLGFAPGLRSGRLPGVFAEQCDPSDAGGPQLGDGVWISLVHHRGNGGGRAEREGSVRGEIKPCRLNVGRCKSRMANCVRSWRGNERCLAKAAAGVLRSEPADQGRERGRSDLPYDLPALGRRNEARCSPDRRTCRGCFVSDMPLGLKLVAVGVAYPQAEP